MSSQTLNELRPSSNVPLRLCLGRDSARPSKVVTIVVRSTPPEMTNLPTLQPTRRELILDNVLPFLIVTFAPPQLRIPEVPLPDRAVSRLYPVVRRG